MDFKDWLALGSFTIAVFSIAITLLRSNKTDTRAHDEDLKSRILEIVDHKISTACHERVKMSRFMEYTNEVDDFMDEVKRSGVLNEPRNPHRKPE